VAKQYQEGKTGKIIPPHDDPEAINIAVQHLYGQSYKDTRSKFGRLRREDHALLNLEACAIADKYNITSLEECAKAEFEGWAWGL
jgi:hypothetical protein